MFQQTIFLVSATKGQPKKAVLSSKPRARRRTVVRVRKVCVAATTQNPLIFCVVRGYPARELQQNIHFVLLRGWYGASAASQSARAPLPATECRAPLFSARFVWRAVGRALRSRFFCFLHLSTIPRVPVQGAPASPLTSRDCEPRRG